MSNTSNIELQEVTIEELEKKCLIHVVKAAILYRLSMMATNLQEEAAEHLDRCIGTASFVYPEIRDFLIEIKNVLNKEEEK